MATNANIIKGDELMLFDSEGNALAFATSHTLTLTGNTVDISSKDHGFWGASEVGNLTWELTSENLYTTADYDKLFDIMVKKEPVTVAFALASNYDPNGLEDVGGNVDHWTPDSANYRSGLAVISSLAVNANTGENATYSVTFTGAGPLTKTGRNVPPTPAPAPTPHNRTEAPVINHEDESSAVVVEAVGDGTVKLYADGTEVENPYSVTKTSSAQTIVFTATAQEDGKTISKTVSETIEVPAVGL